MRILKNSLYAMLSGLLIVMLLQGCAITRAPSSQAQTVKAPESKAVSDINKEIHNTQELIKGYEEHRTRTMHNAAMNDVKRWQTRDYVKLDGHPTYGDLADHGYAEAAATETEIKRLKRKLADLEHKKRELVKQSSGCFLPETMVKMEDGSLKSFVSLQPGQKVLTYDIGYDKLVNKPVIEVYSVKANHLYTINGQLTTTGGERLLTQNGWKKIQNLKQGDFVHLGGSMVKIESIDYVRVNRTLYNMQVADTHNFYVVTTDGSSYLVHNSSGCGAGGSK
jgi:Pretoxin HINT domain